MPQTLEIVPAKGPGGTLVIPSQYQSDTALKEPIGSQDTYRDFGQGCTDTSIDTSCNCVFHDANLGFLHTVASCFQGGGGCVTGSATIDGVPVAVTPCAQSEGCQGLVDATLGVALDSINPATGLPYYPSWLLDELRNAGQLPPERETLGILPDWWTVLCDPVVAVIPGLVKPLIGACPPGTALNQQGQCAKLDPPTPHKGIPKAFDVRGLDPTLKGVPVAFSGMPSCGCEDNQEIEVTEMAGVTFGTVASTRLTPNRMLRNQPLSRATGAIRTAGSGVAYLAQQRSALLTPNKGEPKRRSSLL